MKSILCPQEQIDLTGSAASEVAQLIQAGGGIQVLHATPEQVAHLQTTHQIQILQGDQVLHGVSGRLDCCRDCNDQ